MLIHVAKTWSKRGGNGKPLQYSCYENLINMNRMKRQKDITLVDEIPLGGQVYSMLLGKRENNY